MDRRTFLEWGAAVAAGAAPVAALASREPLPDPANVDLDGWRTQLLGRVTAVRRAPALDAQAARERAGEVDDNREAIATLLVVGSLGDLPAHQRSDPRLSDFLREVGPDLTRGTGNMMARLSALGRDDHRRITQALKADPDLVMRLSQRLGEVADELGIPARRRQHLRSLCTHLSWRLNRQGSELVVGELLDKAHRLAARQGLEDGLEDLLRGYGAGGLTPADRTREVGQGAMLAALAVFGIAGVAGLLGPLTQGDALIWIGIGGGTLGVLVLIVGLIVFTADNRYRGEAK